MADKEKTKELTEKLVSVLSKPQPHYKVCETCGKRFAVNTPEADVKNCITCQVKIDMVLTDDTIINMNILNLWKANKYSKEKGIDPLLCAVAEGIFILPADVKDRNHLSVITTLKAKYGNKDIEKNLNSVIKNANGKYDAVLILRFNAKDDFSIFKVRLSNRLMKKLSNRSLLFIKKYMISLVVKNALKKTRKKK